MRRLVHTLPLATPHAVWHLSTPSGASARRLTRASSARSRSRSRHRDVAPPHSPSDSPTRRLAAPRSPACHVVPPCAMSRRRVPCRAVSCHVTPCRPPPRMHPSSRPRHSALVSRSRMLAGATRTASRSPCCLTFALVPARAASPPHLPPSPARSTRAASRPLTACLRAFHREL
ncbi:hypothetical protein DENSPDRAFT_886153 [Dentipellis sp. KUC8613]|nr:hypothetical protein DENSPDRAFT_886153 [Dentipellis sp. KUC8613]